MKNLIRSAAISVACMIAFCSLSLVGASASTDLEIKAGEGYAYVSDCDERAKGVVEIPETYGGLPVTAIYPEAFKNCGQITEITVPESITRIHSNAFDSCVALKKVVVSNPSCEIGTAAFVYCSALESVELPSQLKTIPNEAFGHCLALKSIEIPSTVALIGTEAFRMCTSLTQVDIPASVTAIRLNAFLGCSSVEAYNVASGNTVYSSKNGVLYGPFKSSYDPDEYEPSADKTLIQYPNAAAATSFTAPSDVLVIADSAFRDNATLTSVTLPNGLKSIEAGAFYNCSALINVNVPSTVTKIGSKAFGECDSLKKITIPGSVESLEDVFYASGLEEVIISEGVTKIGTRNFENCAFLKSVTIPSSVKSIGAGAFYNCSSLETLSIPASVTSIGSNAFTGCDKLKLTVEKGSAAYTYAVNNGIDCEIKEEKPVEKSVVSVEITTLPSKLGYYYKETLNTSGMKLNVTYSDGSAETVTSGFEASPKTLNKTGVQKITVTYGGCSDSFDVSVSYAWWQWIIRILLLGILWY
ncbi:MAG: leucine-rich repeat protein [Clostridia bacterium]|nr:leucine-rich repeat protein [Clostridia bacterium]